jgi:hypothetical protein
MNDNRRDPPAHDMVVTTARFFGVIVVMALFALVLAVLGASPK